MPADDIMSSVMDNESHFNITNNDISIIEGTAN